jgi:hypothetical protein
LASSAPVEVTVKAFVSVPLRETCRAEKETTFEYNKRFCSAPADFIFWGRLYPKTLLGPRCWNCADAGYREYAHIGLSEQTIAQSAIFDLRGLHRER